MRRNGGHGLISALTVAGLLSGLSADPLTMAWYHLELHVGAPSSFDLAIPGLVFGVATGICLLAFRIFNAWQTAFFTCLAGVAYFFSYWVAAGAEVVSIAGQSHDGAWIFGSPDAVSPLSMFAGGAVGGLLVIGAEVLLLRRNIAGLRLVSALSWSLWGGLLGVVGWLLAPSLGMAIWRLFYVVHITALAPPSAAMSSYHISSDTYRGAKSFFYSLYGVWQTGLGLALGVLAQRYMRKVQSTEKESEKP